MLRFGGSRCSCLATEDLVPLRPSHPQANLAPETRKLSLSLWMTKDVWNFSKARQKTGSFGMATLARWRSVGNGPCLKTKDTKRGCIWIRGYMLSGSRTKPLRKPQGQLSLTLVMPSPCSEWCLGSRLRSYSPHTQHKRANLPRASGMLRPPEALPEYWAILVLAFWMERSMPWAPELLWGGGPEPLSTRPSGAGIQSFSFQLRWNKSQKSGKIQSIPITFLSPTT